MMAKGVWLLVCGLFLMVFMVGVVNALWFWDDQKIMNDNFSVTYNPDVWESQLEINTIEIYSKFEEDSILMESWADGKIKEEFIAQNYSTYGYWAETTLVLNNTEYKGLVTGIITLESIAYRNTNRYNGEGILKDNDGNLIKVDISGWYYAGSYFDYPKPHDIPLRGGGSNIIRIIYLGQEIHGQTDLDERISALETWQQLTQVIINQIIGRLDFIEESLANFDDRIDVLENSSSSGGGGGSSNETFPEYLNYLSSSDRKAILCGYGEDNHLANITDLGYNCTLTYRQTSRGETASCRCRSL